MKKKFLNRLDAIEWIAKFTDDEGLFEVLREQLNFNFIYTGEFFILVNTEEPAPEIVLLNGDE